MADAEATVHRSETYFSTYVGCKTTTLWTFQDRIQGTPEAGIRLLILDQLAPVGHPKLTYRRSKEHERHDEHSGI
jgi:hypothetical protein